AAAPEEVTVTMDHGMEFGTGTHETTRLCATLLEAHMETGSRVLDIGTGSGILAICASKLGAASVDAFDIDPMAVRVAQENVARNGCTNV
ncbi:50S ribosomal protein L11 methyltransferase, partial [Staphylococcus aureus]|nr:50S ribosomal protein L11 methyltransferase [Staphylococcus aureus]